MSETTPWTIERRWVWGEPVEQATLTTEELATVHGVALLGSAGMGKSWEIKRLISHEKSLGREVHSADIGRKSASGGLDRCLELIANQLKAGASVFLDGLDEAMVANPRATAIVNDWISESVPKGCRIRISCRSAIWPKVLHESIREYCFPEPIIAAELQRLRIDEIRQVLICEKLDPDSCIDQIHRSRVSTLAQQPITLKLLIAELRSGKFSKSRTELFDHAIHRMCIESQERDELGTGAGKKFSVHKLIEAAQRLAIFVVTTGRDLLGMAADIPASDHLISLNELEQLPADAGLRFDTELLRALADTGLFIGGAASGHMQFSERNIAEYLAGIRLARLPVFQSRSILAKDSGWRTGVAGPLRETAAFAASENRELATWIAETDPEVIGLSEVASSELRKIAFDHTIGLFRLHKLTDSQIARGSVWLSGLLHDGAVEQLKQILDERGDGLEDVHAFAIAMCETCNLQQLVPQLGNLLRADSIEFMTRTDAGYALCNLASEAAARELATFLRPCSDFEEQELLGLALRANWPSYVATPQLLELLSDPAEPYHSGAYQGFLHHLELDQFDSADDRVTGLQWAIKALEHGRDSRLLRLATNIALSSVADFNRHEVLSLFLDFVAKADELYLEVFDERESYHEEKIQQFKSMLATDSNMRRRIIGDLVQRKLSSIDLRNAFHALPGLKRDDDFEWLLDQSKRFVMGEHGESYSLLAYTLDWNSSTELTSAWWNAIDSEAIRKTFVPIPFVELESDLAKSMKEEYADMQRYKRRSKPMPVVLTPPPEVRVADTVKAAKLDPLVFPAVVRELALKTDSAHYGYSRLVSDTPGWLSADASLRSEIVGIARNYLLSFKPIPTSSARQSLTSFYRGPLAALLIVLEQDRDWLINQSEEWWSSWSWQMLRELKLDLHGEPNELKEELLKTLYSKVPMSVSNHILGMAKRKDSSTSLDSILERVFAFADESLSKPLLDGVLQREFTGDTLLHVVKFLLRTDAQFVGTLASQLSTSSQNRPMTPTARIGCALLQFRPVESWDSLKAFFEKRPSIAKHILGQYAYEGRRKSVKPEDLPINIAGQLVSALFQYFPPEDDPKHEGAHYVDQVDVAVSLRNGLLNRLTEVDEDEAREAVRLLELEFGQKYRWLRRARAHAQQLHLMNRWQPIPLNSVAAILHSSESKLLRSGEDVVEAIMYALEQYDRQLHTPPPSTLNALWNDEVQRKGESVALPYPREEEHASDEVMNAIKSVFDNRFAVTASREVQIFRRRVSGKEGNPGSLTDVFVEVPAAGMASGARVTVIVEVKRSCNSEVKHALKLQLVDRYLAEDGTDYGVYVVAFFDNSTGLRRSDKPKWRTIEEAKDDLTAQADVVSVNGKSVRSYVLDARRT